MRQREQQEALALEDMPRPAVNGDGDERQEIEENMALIGQEVALREQLEKTEENDLQFKTPVRANGEGAMVLASLERLSFLEGQPLSFAPPLFSPQQLLMMDEMYLKTSSPLLPRALPSMQAMGSQGQGVGRVEEESRRMSREMLCFVPPEDPPRPQRFQIGSRPPSGGQGAGGVEEQMWRLHVGRELREMGERLSQADQENRALKEEIALIRLENKFYTPESEKGRQLGVSAEQSAPPLRPEGADQPKAEPNQMDLILLMMQIMQEMQKRMMSREDQGASNGVEIVRNGASDLPKLAEWDSHEGPLRMGDWMALFEPAISDLSNTSELWWSEMVREVQEWYQAHIKMAPLDRAAHEPSAPPSLQLRQWQRLERRVASMLLAAVPEQQREELVASKRLTVFSIMCHLQLTYQPGGLGERQTLLHNIESPPEAQSLGDAVLGLRRWMRWRQRAAELQASEPDPSVLVRAVTKLTAKVLSSHSELSFRIALARSTLMVDTRPTREVVGQFSTHLLAEIEQVAHMERKTLKVKTETVPKLKKLDEETKGLGKGYKGKDGQKSEDKQICKYFTQENGSGCKKGKSCRWAHVMDDKRRCYTCGSTTHMANKCPTATSGDNPISQQKVIKAEKDDAPRTEHGDAESVTGLNAGTGEGPERVKSLIEEANQMLKAVQVKNEQDAQKNAMDELQRQLNELRGRPGGSLKAFKLTRMSAQEDSPMALLDSGATHPLRSLEVGDQPETMSQVRVSLADGTKIDMLMTKAGVMVLDQNIEPIIPLGWLARSSCTVEWNTEGLEVIHPVRGLLPVFVKSGCPQIPKTLALDLIKEYEMNELERVLKKLETEIDQHQDPDAEVVWLEELLQDHPTLREIPEKIKKELVLKPGEWNDLPGNRFKRKELKKGCVVHLFAGPDEGYTLAKAMKTRGFGKKILEIDILRGEDRNMLGDSRVYKGLLRAVLDGSVHAIVGGPNCRSRSVLRHYQPGPRPLRRWDGEEFGLKDLTVEEQTLVDDDDTLMWRLVFLGIVGDFVKRSINPAGKMIFALEQPEEPSYKPEVVSFWWTREWKSLKMHMDWFEQAFNQGDLVYKPEATPVKPTKFGGNLEMMLPKERNYLAVSRPSEGSGDSKTLARWVPRLMDVVADALCRQAFGVKDEIKCKAMTWAEHCAAGHVPFRRDCRVCQESSVKGRPHRKIVYPLNGTLSVDVAGPLKKAKEMFWAEGGGYMRYILVGVFTWLKPKGGNSDPPEVHADGEEQDLPELVDEEADEDLLPEIGGEEMPDGEQLDGDAPEVEEVEEREEPELNIFRFCIPLQGKTKEVVLGAINELYIQLRVHGYTVARLHSDRGGEFRGKGLDQWCRTRDIHRTKTAGMSPQSNGRVERSVQEIKARIQRALKGAEMGPEFWPAACRLVHQHKRRRLAMREDRPTPPFGKEVLIKKRYWKRGDLEDTHETALYMYQDYENHGHCVLKSDGTYAIAPYYIAQVTQPLDDSVWIAVLEEIDKERDALAVRRRLREKTAGSIARLQALSDVGEWNMILAVDEAVDLQKKDREEHVEALRNVLEEEGRIMVMDGLESMMSTFEEIRKIKKVLPQGSEEEDVLRTRIVSVQELLEEREKWTAAIQTEMDQLFKEKRALVKINEEEFKELQKRFGMRLTVVPMKCVLTKKLGPKRRFRMVACGNYAERTADDTYAAGADAMSVRYALKKAAEKSWSGVVIDVKTAFLNAPLYESELVEEAVVLKPPYLLLKLGFAQQGEYYKAEKAIYGLRQSPKRWGDFRDQRMRDMVSPSGYYFRQSVTEPNMWRILRKTTEKEEQDEILAELHGFILVYVDDMLTLALRSDGRSDGRDPERMLYVCARVSSTRKDQVFGHGTL